MPYNYPYKTSFTLPEAQKESALLGRKLEFLTGTPESEAELTARNRALLGVFAEQESRREMLQNQRDIQEQGLEIEREQNRLREAQMYDVRRSEEKNRQTQLYAGAAGLASELLFAPMFSTNTAGNIQITSGISKIGSIIKKIFT